MSEEIKKTEKPALTEQDLDKVAGGTYVRTRSNTTTAVEPPTPPKKTPGTNPL